MSGSPHESWIQICQEVLNQCGLLTKRTLHDFELVGTNGACVVLVYQTAADAPEIVKALNSRLSGVFFEKRLGQSSRELYAVILATRDLSHMDMEVIESDTRICRKFVQRVEDPEFRESLTRTLTFLRPVELPSKLESAESALRSLYLEALSDAADQQTSELLRKIIAEEWTPDQIVKALEEL